MYPEENPPLEQLIQRVRELTSAMREEVERVKSLRNRLSPGSPEKAFAQTEICTALADARQQRARAGAMRDRARRALAKAQRFRPAV